MHLVSRKMKTMRNKRKKKEFELLEMSSLWRLLIISLFVVIIINWIWVFSFQETAWEWLTPLFLGFLLGTRVGYEKGVRDEKKVNSES